MADRFFVGDTDSDWHDTDNWSASSGGAGGASIPGASDRARFDNNSPNCTLEQDISDVGQLWLESSFGNTLDTDGYDVTVSGTTSVTIDGGTFTFSNTSLNS